MTAPNVEERLSYAAFVILTDGQRHSHEAQRWAARFMRVASKGRETAFQRGIGFVRERTIVREGSQRVVSRVG